MKIPALFLIGLSTTLFAANLPDWAKQATADMDPSQVPQDAGIWCLLDETTLILQDNGTVHKQRRLVKVVLREWAANRASVFVIDGDETATRIKKLKGWHKPVKGKVKKLDKDHVVSLGESSRRQLTTSISTYAFFQGVKKGSIIAFESKEIIESFFPISTLGIMAPYPIKKRVISLGALDGTRETSLTLLNCREWGIDSQQRGGNLVFNDLPAYRTEVLEPEFSGVWPQVVFGFLNKDREKEPIASWDNLASWYAKLFQEKAGEMGQAATSLQQIQTEADYIRERVTYRQHYLTPSRGWVPMSGEEVDRLAYGDCKDTVACLAYRFSKLKIRVLPVLVSIGNGPRTGPDDHPHPGAFNHLIAAIELEKSLGQSAEVKVGGKRYLIYDPTDKYTPLGYLDGGYRNRNLLICSDQGAMWTRIDDVALEDQSMAFYLKGSLDADFTLKGSLRITEYGNAYGFRAGKTRGNRRDMEWRVRGFMDLPGTALLIPRESEINDRGKLVVNYQILWPGFLKRDNGGYRLAESITGSRKPGVIQTEKERQGPVYVSEIPAVTWSFRLNSEVPLQPKLAKQEFADDFVAYKWEASGGKVLWVKFEQARSAAWFPMDRRGEGLTWWDAYSHRYDGFLRQAALFIKP